MQIDISTVVEVALAIIAAFGALIGMIYRMLVARISENTRRINDLYSLSSQETAARIAKIEIIEKELHILDSHCREANQGVFDRANVEFKTMIDKSLAVLEKEIDSLRRNVETSSAADKSQAKEILIIIERVKDQLHDLEITQTGYTGLFITRAEVDNVRKEVSDLRRLLEK